jgi:hypothetical protein
MSRSVVMPSCITLSAEEPHQDNTEVSVIAAPFAGRIESATVACLAGAKHLDAVFDIRVKGVSVFAGVADYLTMPVGTRSGMCEPTASASASDFVTGDIISVVCVTASATANLTVVLVLEADLNPTD